MRWRQTASQGLKSFILAFAPSFNHSVSQLWVNRATSAPSLTFVPLHISPVFPSLHTDCLFHLLSLGNYFNCCSHHHCMVSWRSLHSEVKSIYCADKWHACMCVWLAGDTKNQTAITAKIVKGCTWWSLGPLWPWVATEHCQSLSASLISLFVFFFFCIVVSTSVTSVFIKIMQPSILHSIFPLPGYLGIDLCAKKKKKKRFDIYSKKCRVQYSKQECSLSHLNTVVSFCTEADRHLSPFFLPLFLLSKSMGRSERSGETSVQLHRSVIGLTSTQFPPKALYHLTFL